MMAKLFSRIVDAATPDRSAIAGFVAVGIYLAATALGGILDPTYSQLRQHVSDLTATGAPTRVALAPLYLLYNGATVFFALGLYKSSPRRGLDSLGLWLLIANAFAGVMMVTPFAEDLGGVPTTPAGHAHLWFAGLSSAAIVGATFVLGASFRRWPKMVRVSRPSIAIGIAFLVLGPLAVLATAQRTLAGLAERGPIGAFLVWLVWVSVALRGVAAQSEPAPMDGARKRMER